jgi:hypothetical protein
MVPPRSSGRIHLVILIALTVTLPFGIRLADAWHEQDLATPSYLPATEAPRAREPFNPEPIADLAHLNPGYVVIGDSMAGTRIDVARFTELAGRNVAPLLAAASGSAYWYLVLKNYVVASGIHPRAVFIFFRDTNLTDVAWRLDNPANLDPVAHDREDELNAAVAARVEGRWYRLEHAVEYAYGAQQARQWLGPGPGALVGETMIPGRRRRAQFLDEVNARLGLEHLRPMEAADMQAAQDRDADFHQYVDRSVLPLMLREASAHGLTLCFVRVQRRPLAGRPPYQSPALQRYMRDLRAYVEAHGALLRDDTGDPELTLDMYEDGDHIAAAFRRRYTEILVNRLAPLFDGAGAR